MPSAYFFQRLGIFLGIGILTMSLGYFFLIKTKVDQLAVIQTKERIFLEKWKKKTTAKPAVACVQ